MSAAPRRSPGLAARLGRTIAIVVIFVVAGAPLGGLAFTLLVASVFGSMGKFDPGYELAESPLGLLLTGMALGYWFGTGPVALAGFAIGVKQAFFGPTSWWMALGVGLLAGVVLVDSLPLGFDPDLGPQEAIMILSCVVAIMLCWSMVRNWWFAVAARETAS